MLNKSQNIDITPGRRQSKRLSTMDEHISKNNRSSVFDCHLSPVWRQMEIKNSVYNDFRSTFLNSIGIFDCCLPGVDKAGLNLGVDIETTVMTLRL